MNGVVGTGASEDRVEADVQRRWDWGWKWEWGDVVFGACRGQDFLDEILGGQSHLLELEVVAEDRGRGFRGFGSEHKHWGWSGRLRRLGFEQQLHQSLYQYADHLRW
jgi:hypothetical protein